MAFWLLKTEPSEFSYSDLERGKRAVWDGVKNNTALIHLRAMRKGDRALIYHSGGEKSLVGLADIVSNPYPDPNVGDPKIVVVDLSPAGRLTRPVPLGAIKKEKEFASFELIRISRLSVMPVPPILWKKLLTMAN
jgi:predicted RNA-binding protein with PUA-like domain